VQVGIVRVYATSDGIFGSPNNRDEFMLPCPVAAKLELCTFVYNPRSSHTVLGTVCTTTNYRC